MKETEGEEFEDLQIKDASKAISNVLNILNDKMEVDLLHVNCEVTSFYRSIQTIPLAILSRIRVVNGKCSRI